jgi:hypothetical protein
MGKMMRNKILIVFLLLSTGLIQYVQHAYAGHHEDPPHKMIEQAYFKCEASRNLEGGNYGKGPFKRFGPKDSLCSEHEWVRISQEEFKTLAEKWYGVNWSKEIPFWNHTQ